MSSLEERRAYNREKSKAWRLARRAYIDTLRSQPCTDCGKTFPPYVMEFDHVPERGKKEFVVAKICLRASNADLEAEIAKCDIVCANCHKIRTYVRRIK